MISGKNIVIGVTGGIAAYKAVYLVRELQEAGAEVRVTMTAAAARFVGGDTFAAITRHDVPVHIFPEDPSQISENWTRHIHWAEWADMLVIAPCTANSLAKIVHGFSDSMLTATVLAARCPILICPTMDGEMYRSPATRSNLEKAGDMGFHLLEPDSGYLASGMQGIGRLPEPDRIIGRMEEILSDHITEPSRFLEGKHVLVTCGATREHLDPVRFLSNPSTGKMGLAMAAAARSCGARVTLLHAGSVDTGGVDATITRHAFSSTDELFRQVKAHADADIVIMTAAVSDFRPAQKHEHKVSKDSAELSITLERTPDILQWLGENRKKGQILIGFAMETRDLVPRSREKRIRKKADWIVGNDLTMDGSGFAVDTNNVVLVGEHMEKSLSGSKKSVARQLLQQIFESQVTG
ncbi:bifunctional phosphopantothenoylcysteine decarboxylase/phosphopantothenate--cysteine ligase CoaBC [Natronogracilivirga saccharolytica]|uniref:Coenzyme A biosynthesis bifunctional protein CoaBC n=1 Tax=Natronogracilivirga saccharolytica TaxID=2812953 RepID=A0A8J7URZ9_9BACT|nr:bifunctional phosphopantothenoylcysteine decarboxylase/phosphopantothenate--cysteine ligase CoaBC [Natronogracilivirga saccharolytica]MBP3191046.1 bifunctional phosphopantothenoylcysteine decarboxylase/phosphopantothenate--cysteine ligase CoaBC [Natronogracilivirga saccharolytica]